MWLPGLIFSTATFTQSDVWVNKADMPTARLGHATCVVDGKIYAIGGYRFANDPGLTTVEVYDPVMNIWTSGPSLPTTRVASVCAVDSKIYIIGGAFTVRPPHPAVSTVEVCDIKSIIQPVTPKSIKVLDIE
jgi:N-acetylneuraminic acid mutarotase